MRVNFPEPFVAEEADDRTGGMSRSTPFRTCFSLKDLTRPSILMMGEVMGCSCRVVPDGGLV